MEQLLTPKQTKELFNVSDSTLRKWEKEGKIECVRPGGSGFSHRRYRVKPENKEEPKESIIYARVSSHGQKEDLERQIATLQNKFPTHRIIKDIGSGLNFKRKGFKTILELAIKGNIRELVVTNKDRLCRFGFELFEAILKPTNGNIVVLYKDNESSPERELVDDVISIITVFSAKMYGRRSHRNSREKKPNMENNGQRETTIQNNEI